MITLNTDPAVAAYDEASGPPNPHPHYAWRLMGDGPEDSNVLAVILLADAERRAS